MIIRQEKKEDKKDVYHIHELAFGQKEESKLVDELRKCPEFIPELSLVAELDGKIIGHILFTTCWIVDKNGTEYPSLTMAPVGVHNNWQNRGVGGKLIKEGLNRARELGHTSVIVLGHASYYPRFGFEKASKWHISSPHPVPDEAFMAIELIPQKLAGKEGTVKYAPPFDHLEVQNENRES